MKSDYFVFAVRNLRRRGIRSWLTLLGIVIGIIAVVSLISLGGGLKMAVNSQFGVSSTQALTVQAGGISGFGPPGSGVVKSLTRQDAEAIAKLSTVELTTPRNIETLRVEYNNKVIFGAALSIDEGHEAGMYETMDLNAKAGKMLYPGDLGKIVIGSNLADGDKNGFEKPIEVGQSLLIQDKKFRVIGILEKKGSFIIDNIILMYDQNLNDLVNYGDNVDIIGVKVKDPSLMNKTKTDIEKLLRERRNVKVGQEDFEVSTPAAMLATVNSILGGVQAFIVLIALISIFVGAIGIVNTMTTSVMERVKEIGIMKAIGAKNSDIFFQFFIEAGLLGFVGGVIGVLIGLGIGFIGIQGINSFIGASTPFNPSIFLVVGTLVGSFIIGSISGIAPAMRAARLNPVEALRK